MDEELKSFLTTLDDKTGKKLDDFGGKIDEMRKDITDIKVDVKGVKDKSHDPLECKAMERHEKDHARNESRKDSNLSAALRIAGLLLTVVTMSGGMAWGFINWIQPAITAAKAAGGTP